MNNATEPAWSASATAADGAASLWSGVLSSALALLLVLGLALIVLRGLKRLQARRGIGAGDAPQVLSAVAVGPRERIVVVAYRGQRHLLAFSAGGVCVVARHTADAHAPAAAESGNEAVRSGSGTGADHAADVADIGHADTVSTANPANPAGVASAARVARAGVAANAMPAPPPAQRP